jgi:hypothetical protein
METPPHHEGGPLAPPIAPTSLRHLTSLCTAALIFSFFMPWITFFSSRLSGLDIQRNFSSYQLVCVMPIMGAIVLMLNLAGRDTNLIRRIAGLVPFVILLVAINRLGSDLFKILEFGAWVAPAAGAALVCIPNETQNAK